MGQKTHPKAFRLVSTQQHLSQWYAKKSSYPHLIEEDFFVRQTILKQFSEIFSISNIEIVRIGQENSDKQFVKIKISGLFPRSKEMSRKIGNYFQEDLSTQKGLSLFPFLKGNLKKFSSLLLKRKIRNLVRFFQQKTNKDYFICLQFIKNPFEDAVLIAHFIGDQLKKRIPFRRVIKQTMRKVQKTSLQGIKIQLSGRLNGAEIARSEWKREGRVPLHTLRAKIDYTHQIVQTIYGIIGIKIWLFAGEKREKEKIIC